MKSYEEIAESVLKRRDAYEEQRKKRAAVIRKYSSIGAVICCVMLIAFGINKANPSDENDNSGYVINVPETIETETSVTFPTQNHNIVTSYNTDSLFTDVIVTEAETQQPAISDLPQVLQDPTEPPIEESSDLENNVPATEPPVIDTQPVIDMTDPTELPVIDTQPLVDPTEPPVIETQPVVEVTEPSQNNTEDEEFPTVEFPNHLATESPEIPDTEKEIYTFNLDASVDKYRVLESNIESGEIGSVVATNVSLNYSQGSVKADIYEINGFGKEFAVAVKFEGTDYYKVAKNLKYTPKTLGDMINITNFSENVYFGDVYITSFENDYELKLYMEVDNSIIHELISEHAHLENVFDSSYFPYDCTVEIYTSIPGLGISKSIGIIEEGYIFTNIPDYGAAFYIGPEKAAEFITYIEENYESISLSSSGGEANLE